MYSIIIDNQIDIATGTVKLKAEFANQSDALFPNQFVNIRMKVRTLQNALTIPAAAVQQGNRGAFVYVIGTDDIAAVKPVKLGDRSGERVVVLDGIKMGDRVVLEGTDRLRAGAKVRVIGAPSAAGGQNNPGQRPAGAQGTTRP